MDDQDSREDDAPPEPARWTPAKQRAFLSRLAERPNVTVAARAVGMSRDSAYALRRRNVVFARKWADALEQGYSELEHVLLHQSLNGTERVENVYDADGTLKSIRKVRSFPLGDASRLLRAHRDSVTSYRAQISGLADYYTLPPDTVRLKLEEEIAKVHDRIARVEPEADAAGAGGEAGAAGEASASGEAGAADHVAVQEDGA